MEPDAEVEVGAAASGLPAHEHGVVVFAGALLEPAQGCAVPYDLEAGDGGGEGPGLRLVGVLGQGGLGDEWGHELGPAAIEGRACRLSRFW